MMTLRNIPIMLCCGLASLCARLAGVDYTVPGTSVVIPLVGTMHGIPHTSIVRFSDASVPALIIDVFQAGKRPTAFTPDDGTMIIGGVTYGVAHQDQQVDGRATTGTLYFTRVAGRDLIITGLVHTGDEVERAQVAQALASMHFGQDLIGAATEGLPIDFAIVDDLKVASLMPYNLELTATSSAVYDPSRGFNIATDVFPTLPTDRDTFLKHACATMAGASPGAAGGKYTALRIGESTGYQYDYASTDKAGAVVQGRTIVTGIGDLYCEIRFVYHSDEELARYDRQLLLMGKTLRVRP